VLGGAGVAVIARGLVPHKHALACLRVTGVIGARVLVVAKHKGPAHTLGVHAPVRSGAWVAVIALLCAGRLVEAAALGRRAEVNGACIVIVAGVCDAGARALKTLVVLGAGVVVVARDVIQGFLATLMGFLVAVVLGAGIAVVA